MTLPWPGTRMMMMMTFDDKKDDARFDLFLQSPSRVRASTAHRKWSFSETGFSIRSFTSDLLTPPGHHQHCSNNKQQQQDTFGYSATGGAAVQTTATSMLFGRPAGLRGFRPRSETNYMRVFAVALGVATGFYIFTEPLKEAAGDVVQEKAAGGGGGSDSGGCPQGGKGAPKQ
jgi:hypothetical protein